WSKSGVEETSVLWCFFNLFGVLIPIAQVLTISLKRPLNITHTFANALNAACIILMPRQRHGRRHAVVTCDTGVKPPKPGVSRY
ncbi:hypothetical protein PSY83_23510, partial [Shigella flexneri]|nr:hypothetical protein [Shigella flexneri]MDD0435085.1 hypothetical protein [Shigella sonnei]MDC9966711.1 hypothetical protein [Shigella flexneri]MDC9991387.1 hypothetical protein [Shigella flexneri]MDD0036680.1 hypothetical protein [Shigella flexneri]